VCGRATLTTDPEELRKIFELQQGPDMAPRYNLAPSQPIAVIREPHRLELLRWGLPKGHGAGINVRVETVARAPAYRESFWKRRCLVVVDGFYEWKKEGNARRPFAVRRADGKPFALAGIWEHSVTSDGKVTDACAIITGAANGVVAPLHDRMPLIVPTKGYARWLSQDARTPELLKLIETDASSLVSYAVNPLVNSAANDDPRCLEPFTS
jgi:putative SOS response-associated peptidase YedK